MSLEKMAVGLLALAAASVCAEGARADPMFDAFRQLCVETSGAYPAIARAADAGAWQPVQLGVNAMKTVVVSDKLTRTKTVGGGDVTLSAWTGKTTSNVVVSDCTVQTSRGDFAAALASVQGWVGFAPQDNTGDKAIFRFTDQAGAHKALQQADYDAAAAGAGMEILTVSANRGSLNLDLLRIKK